MTANRQDGERRGRGGKDVIVYPRPRNAANAVFADYQSGDLDVEPDVF